MKFSLRSNHLSTREQIMTIVIPTLSSKDYPYKSSLFVECALSTSALVDFLSTLAVSRAFEPQACLLEALTVIPQAGVGALPV